MRIIIKDKTNLVKVVLEKRRRGFSGILKERVKGFFEGSGCVSSLVVDVYIIFEVVRVWVSVLWFRFFR